MLIPNLQSVCLLHEYPSRYALSTSVDRILFFLWLRCFCCVCGVFCLTHILPPSFILLLCMGVAPSTSNNRVFEGRTRKPFWNKGMNGQQLYKMWVYINTCRVDRNFFTHNTTQFNSKKTTMMCFWYPIVVKAISKPRISCLGDRSIRLSSIDSATPIGNWVSTTETIYDTKRYIFR